MIAFGLNLHRVLAMCTHRLQDFSRLEAMGDALHCCVRRVQTVGDPASSLSTERRGTVCLPDIESCNAVRGRGYGKVRDTECTTWRGNESRDAVHGGVGQAERQGSSPPILSTLAALHFRVRNFLKKFLSL